MKKPLLICLALITSSFAGLCAQGGTSRTNSSTTVSGGGSTIVIPRDVAYGARPIMLNLTGITGEAAQVIQFDLYVQGFAFTNAEGAQFQISGSANGNLTARAVDRMNQSTLVSKAYTGGPLRYQAHAFCDDFVQALGRKGIAQTKIIFKSESGSNGEICLADFDGFAAQEITKDNTIVRSPAWVPGRMAIYYTSYKWNRPDIFYHDLSTGARKVFARYGGSNLSPAPSPDGSQVAMCLSKDGWTDIYVGGADGSAPLRLTKSREDESSPCWSPDGKWVCFATKLEGRRSLCKVPAGGGKIQRVATVGVGNPTEPDWSPDGKSIVFTSQRGGGFDICVVPAEGGNAVQLVAGEDPSWAGNSRTVVFSRRQGGKRVLSLLDVPTKQVKDIPRIPGSNSQPSWAR